MHCGLSLWLGCVLFRSQLPVRGNNANNLAEAGVRILFLFSRVKAYNLVHLLSTSLRTIISAGFLVLLTASLFVVCMLEKLWQSCTWRSGSISGQEYSRAPDSVYQVDIKIGTCIRVLGVVMDHLLSSASSCYEFPQDFSILSTNTYTLLPTNNWHISLLAKKQTMTSLSIPVCWWRAKQPDLMNEGNTPRLPDGFLARITLGMQRVHQIKTNLFFKRLNKQLQFTTAIAFIHWKLASSSTNTLALHRYYSPSRCPTKAVEWWCHKIFL